MPLRLDVVLAYIGANVSNPLLAPVLLALSLQVGSFLLTGEFVPFDVAGVTEKGVFGLVREVFVGSVVLGVVLGAAAGMLIFMIARHLRPDVALDAAIRRTIRRYRTAPLADRLYVRLKLQLDPVCREIALLGPLGTVLDAGAGRGQLGLFLWELGHASALSGFDFDARKVSVASAAARDDAQYSERDLRTAVLPSADTILLVDVLHYLPSAEQDALLMRARQSLRLHGRLVVREIDAEVPWKSWIARLSERALARLGYNRAAVRLEFRSAEAIRKRLSALGLTCELLDAGQGTPFENRLIVGELRDQKSSNSLQNSSDSRSSSKAER